MLKFFIAEIRWGSLSPQQKEILKDMSFIQVFKRPYLEPKLFKHY